MAGLLADVYSYGDSLKRKMKDLASDPYGVVSRGISAFGEDQQKAIDNMLTATGIGGSNSVLTPQSQKDEAMTALGDGMALSLSIDPKAKPIFIDQLKVGGVFEPLKVGDITQGQGNRARGLLGGNGPSTNDVTVTPFRSEKVRNSRVLNEGFSPEFIGDVTEQGMRKSARVELDPASRNQNPSLVQDGMRDPITGRIYSARVPIGVSKDGKTWDLLSSIPDGLPPRKKPPTK